jgi:hypothetical protein
VGKSELFTIRVKYDTGILYGKLEASRTMTLAAK